MWRFCASWAKFCVKETVFMFGYVTVAKNQLTEDEYKMFCAYYCGVCRATAAQGSQAARLALSYDITFLAIVLSSVLDGAPQTVSKGCAAHPIKKRESVLNDPAVDYAAAVGVLLSYLKLADDRRDDRSFKAAAGMAVMHSAYRRAGKRYGAESDMIKWQLDILSSLEESGCGSVDETADAFAKILEGLFTPPFIEDEPTRRALAWLGYNLGRWIYIIDAYNDMDRDFGEGAYNPFLAGGKTPQEQKGLPETELSLTFTLENIASAFELIDFKKNKSIIGKMIYTSLKAKQRSVLSGEDAGGRQMVFPGLTCGPSNGA